MGSKGFVSVVAVVVFCVAPFSTIVNAALVDVDGETLLLFIIDDGEVLVCVVVNRDAAVEVDAAAAANKSLACMGKKFVGIGFIVVVLITCKEYKNILVTKKIEV